MHGGRHLNFLWTRLKRSEDEAGNVPAGALAFCKIFNRDPLYVAEITNVRLLAEDGLDHHQQPFIDRIDQNDGLSFLPLLDGLPNPCRRAFLLALVHDGSEGWIDIADRSPLTGESVKAFRKRKGAWIEVETELRMQPRIQVRRGQPIMLPVVAVAFVEFVLGRREK